ncbi:sigma factor [Streptomyces sp. HC307]|uniref:sigma factor n=1 Tax=Streptomyces flavusporus TaxID=3385496 RepID=UPI0039174F27
MSHSDRPVPKTHDATDVFVGHRELLFGIVYTMPGSVADTDDVLQETWLSWSARTRAESADRIASPRAYLVRIAVNHALARRAAISRRRETYLTEIAEIIDRSPAAVRQLARRARAHVRARRPRYWAHPRVRREATERFVRAALGGDIAALMEVLAPDATVWTDSGGNRRAGLRPVHGRDKAVRLLTGYAARRGTQGLDLSYRRVNGDDAAVLFQGDSPYALNLSGHP